MSDEFINITTEDTFDVENEEIVEVGVIAEDLEQNVEVSEFAEVVEVEPIEEIEIEVTESIGWVGGDSTRHYSLYGRDESDQHPITAITGLREELNDIEALDVVYSNEKNHADYYLWEDENILQENRIGYFVSACSDINKIKKCAADDDILGVTVDSAGFVGAQDDIARDIKYGLVVTTGVVHVRCEQSVGAGDYVVSNDYGYAKSNKNGYKVVGRHQIDGVEYAEIVLAAPINRICKLSDDVENVNTRMEDAEKNIVSAINVANAAYNKAVECNNVSEDAVKNALEALNKSNGVVEDFNSMQGSLSMINGVAVEARMIAESAGVSAEAIRREAVATANDALTKVYETQDEFSELVKEMTPLSEWEGENGKGIVGFVARANADSATLATLAEWKEEGGDNQSLAGTVAQVNKHQAILDHITSKQGVNGSTIAQIEQKADDNGASITNLVASVDKYSVGEYSQAYGLTREQAIKILKSGYIYVPTEHEDKQSHSEIFVGEDEVNEFTPGSYYVWQGSDWEEHTGAVIFQSSSPANSNNTYKYWYLNSSEPMVGYEAYTLYMWEEGQWKKINTLAGNVTNRITSMIRQTQNEISLKVATAQDGVAAHQLWLDTNSANIQDVVSWKSDLDSKDASNIATIKQTADAAGSSIAQIAASIGNYTTIEGTWDEVGKDTKLTYYTTEEKMYWYYKDGRWNSTDNAADAGLVINAASIITAINNDTSEVTLNADRINLLSEEIALGGYLTQPWSDIRALVGKNVNGNPGFFLYADNEHYKQSEGVYKPYMEFWPSNNGKSMITGVNELYLRVDQMDGSYFDSLKCMSSGGSMRGEWSIYNTENNLRFYVGTSGGSMRGEWSIDNAQGNTMFRVKSSGGNLYGDWNINNYKLGSEIVSSDGTHLGRFEYYSGAPYDCQAVYFAKPISFFSGTHKGGSSWGFSYYINGNNQYGVFAVCSGGGYLNGTWKLNNSTLTASDRNKKNSIENLDERYNTFFDNLCPIRYKYNDGTSSRYHTGFIAQDVEQAIANSNLDTLDFAGYVKDEDGVSYLRYEEFVSLNTQQIQKAKTRIAELENKVEKLEALIKGE